MNNNGFQENKYAVRSAGLTKCVFFVVDGERVLVSFAESRWILPSEGFDVVVQNVLPSTIGRTTFFLLLLSH